MAKYTVQKGDTLSAIGKKYGVSYQDIAKENNISNPNLIHAGQTLNITIPGQKPYTETTVTPEPSGNANVGSTKTGTSNTVAPNYGAFTPSNETTAAGQRKESLLAQKPGEFTYDAYTDSDIVIQANNLLNQHIAGKPGEYKPVWQDEADSYLSQYQNRDPFSYDFNSDALYNQYKDQYIQQGRMAMMDTMGQAAAMTGGYGNSYAQTVGQQAYNQQLGQLNEIMPELYGMARDQYNQEGQQLLDMYGLYMDKENQEYGRYQDNLNNWYKHLDYLTEDARTKREDAYNTWLDERNMDYQLWQDGYNAWLDEVNQADADYWNLYNRDYAMSRDAIADSQWQQSFDSNEKANAKSDLINLITSTGYNPTDAELSAAGMSREQAKGYINAYIASQNQGSPYLKLEAGSEAHQYISKRIADASNFAQLKAIAEEYVAMGYDPKVIEKMTADKYLEFKQSGNDAPADPRAYIKDGRFASNVFMP